MEAKGDSGLKFLNIASKLVAIVFSPSDQSVCPASCWSLWSWKPLIFYLPASGGTISTAVTAENERKFGIKGSRGIELQ